MDDELAAVTVPSFANAALRVGILSTFTVPGVSSAETTVSPRRPLIVTGVISVSNEPSLAARFARVTDSIANAS